MPDDRDQRTEDRDQMTEIRGQKLELGSRKAEFGMIKNRQRAWGRAHSLKKTDFLISLLSGSVGFAFFRFPHSAFRLPHSYLCAMPFLPVILNLEP